MTDSIVATVLAELADTGYGRLTMDGVARRAGSSKATLYRRWSSKEEMVTEALGTVSLPRVPSESSGALLDDLQDLTRSVYDWLGDPVVRSILPDLIAEGLRNRPLGDALTRHIGEPRRRAAAPLLESAIARGELAADTDIELVLDLIAAPIFWRICGRREKADEAFVTAVATSVYRCLVHS